MSDLQDGGEVYSGLAQEILRRHNDGSSETDIRTAVWDFIIRTGLAAVGEVSQEESPADGASGRVDLTARDTFFEFKRNLYGGGGIDAHIGQLDGYLNDALTAGRSVRNGVLTDGRRWFRRRIGDGAADAPAPPDFLLETPAGGLRLYEWLRDYVFEARAVDVAPTAENLQREFGDARRASNQDFATLTALYEGNGGLATIGVKRRLWEDLLRAALGEVAGTPDELDDLFIRHTYLSAVIGMAVQASFGINLPDLAEREAPDLLLGRRLKSDTGLSGIVESDFFTWPVEVAGGAGFIRQLAARVSRFDWRDAPADIAAILYQTVIPADERRQLGEYYTPQWLADAMAVELIDDPLEQRVLDPSCGSGTFIVAAVGRFLAAARESGLEPKEVLDRLRAAVLGIDVHPAAVHLARAAWAFAAREAISAAAGFNTEISAPIYLGDALQLRYRTGDMFAVNSVTIETRATDLGSPALEFPMSLVERADTFDALLSDIADAIANGDDPMLAMDDHGVTDTAERQQLEQTIATMTMLHRAERNHIWAYYTRNMVRPVVLSRRKVDVIIGNPPWLNYNQTANILRDELELQSKNSYGIWQGGRYASNQDIASLFFARSVDLYLRDGGVIGMVLPHSALQTGQYAKWRTGIWESKASGRGRNRIVGRTLAMDFAYKTAWDLEQLEPNTFFPVASCVAFAKRMGENADGTALAGTVERWLGKAGTPEVRRVTAGITDTSVAGASPYASYARQGASIRPRRLFFVQETESRAIIQAGQTVTVNPRRGGQDKVPWKDLDLTAITGQTIENRHVYDVHLGETIVPYATLEPLKVVLPVKRGEYEIPTDVNGPGGIRLGGLERRMRERWQTVNKLWEDNKPAASNLNLLESLNHYGKLSSQLAWQQQSYDRPIRLVYTAGGEPTAALISDDAALVDERLYWVTCKDMDEADYLLAIINSDALYEAVTPLMNKGQFGARDLHKHLWKLAIPEFDGGEPVHRELSWLGGLAREQASERLGELREERGGRLTVTIARRELRGWLRGSNLGRCIEMVVKELFIRQGVLEPTPGEPRPQSFMGVDAATLLREVRAEREEAIAAIAQGGR